MMLRSMILKPRMIAKRQCGGVDSGLKLLHVSGSRLRENRPGDTHKDEGQEKQCASPREKLQFHRSPVVIKLLVEKPACAAGFSVTEHREMISRLNAGAIIAANTRT